MVDDLGRHDGEREARYVSKRGYCTREHGVRGGVGVEAARISYTTPVLAVHGCLESDARLSVVFLNTKGPELCDAFDDVDAEPVTALHEQPLKVPKVA